MKGNGKSSLAINDSTKKMLDNLPVNKKITYDGRILKLINFYLEHGGDIID